MQRAGSTFRCHVQFPHYGGFSCWRAQALGLAVSIVVVHGLSCSLASSRDLPRPGIEPVSPALVGRFFTTEPLGKSFIISFLKHFLHLVFRTRIPLWPDFLLAVLLAFLQYLLLLFLHILKHSLDSASHSICCPISLFPFTEKLLRHLSLAMSNFSSIFF